ncbi:transcription factor SPT20 homolog [Halyomorpha halys]|uniref:transcription factor SPT20 homolog n=1 Tax=Halyomorpha halys TaxID=286706 RepID=UPI0006D4E6D0|nr:putative uncharacterized protein DDB_G0271606 [Halyomorpha halys]
MKVLLLTLSVIGCAIAEAPYPASGTKPEGALLLLPPEYRQSSNQGASSQLRTETEDLATVSDKVMERLKQEQGSGSGSYHVYLADGRLQKVQFTTAPLKSGQQNTASQQSSGYTDFSGSQQVELFSAQSNKQQNGQFTGEQQQSAPAYSQQYSQQYSQKQQEYPVYSQQQTGESSNQQYFQKQQNSPAYSQQYKLQQTEDSSSQQYFQKQQSAPAYSQQYNQQQTGEASSQQYSQQQYFQKQQSAPVYSQQYNQKLNGESSSQQETAKFSSQYKQTNAQDTELNPIIAQFGKLQQELQQKQIQQLQQKQQELEQQQQELKQQQEELRSASYVASLRYSNVDPITSPIYSYKPSPVTRILRYAPQYY